jgi:uncharacterized membrane protein
MSDSVTRRKSFRDPQWFFIRILAMSDRFFVLPVFAMALVVFAVTYLLAAIIFAGITRLFAAIADGDGVCAAPQTPG